MTSNKAKIAQDVTIGEYAVVEEGVIIGKGTVIGHHAVIRSGSVIGENVRIDDFACIGKQPMAAAASAVTKKDSRYDGCEIKDGAIIGTGAVVYCGSVIGEKTLVADMAVVREDVTIGGFVIIGKGATIENHCRVGSRTKIQTNAYITAYSEIGSQCFIAPCVVTSNDNAAARGKDRFAHFKGVTVKDGGRIGAGAVILPGKTIETEGFAAAAALVTKDIPEKMMAKGAPARVCGPVPPEQLLENQ